MAYVCGCYVPYYYVVILLLIVIVMFYGLLRFCIDTSILYVVTVSCFLCKINIDVDYQAGVLYNVTLTIKDLVQYFKEFSPLYVTIYVCYLCIFVAFCRSYFMHTRIHLLYTVYCNNAIVQASAKHTNASFKIFV